MRIVKRKLMNMEDLISQSEETEILNLLTAVRHDNEMKDLQRKTKKSHTSLHVQ